MSIETQSLRLSGSSRSYDDLLYASVSSWNFRSIGSRSYRHAIDGLSLTGLTDCGVAIKEASSSEFEQVFYQVAHAALTNEPGAVGNTLFSHCGFLCRQKKDRPSGRSIKWGRMKSNMRLNCLTGMVRGCQFCGFVREHLWRTYGAALSSVDDWLIGVSRIGIGDCGSDLSAYCLLQMHTDESVALVPRGRHRQSDLIRGVNLLLRQ